MTFPRKIGLLLLVIAGVATLAHHHGVALPSLRWFYSFAADPNEIGTSKLLANQATYVGWGWCGLMAVIGAWLIAAGGRFQWNPLTLRKLERFRSIGRGHVSFKLILVLLALALLDQALVGKRALAVKYEGEWHYPAFRVKSYSEKDFGGDSEQEPDYRALKAAFEETENQVILPPVPWAPTFDSDESMTRPLPIVNGRIHRENGEIFRGYASEYAKEDPARLLRSGRVRNGLPRGTVDVFGENGEVIGRETWEGGEVVETDVPDDVELPEGGRWVEKIYAPLPPTLARKHFLGTDSKGWDIAAQLYGGMQVIFKAAAFYLFLTYGIGITMGCLMGYFGGVYDLVMQRIMEIMSNVPFLLVVMIISQNIGRDNINLGNILLIFCVFSWIQVAIYLRTSTYKEKARDYVSAARVLGAGTARVIFRHIMPNAISTIVTLVPFSVATIVMALTALDFLGFGVPDSIPSWGRVLDDGRMNLGSPWIVSSVFGMMVLLLLLITFVGEAIREAFDPKKFTTYQ
jgi:microcin C transport system permease protein